MHSNSPSQTSHHSIQQTPDIIYMQYLQLSLLTLTEAPITPLHSICKDISYRTGTTLVPLVILCFMLLWIVPLSRPNMVLWQLKKEGSYKISVYSLPKYLQWYIWALVLPVYLLRILQISTPKGFQAEKNTPKHAGLWGMQWERLKRQLLETTGSLCRWEQR